VVLARGGEIQRQLLEKSNPLRLLLVCRSVVLEGLHFPVERCKYSLKSISHLDRRAEFSSRILTRSPGNLVLYVQRPEKGELELRRSVSKKALGVLMYDNNDSSKGWLLMFRRFVFNFAQLLTMFPVIASAQEQGNYGRQLLADEVVVALESISRQIKANYESIDTWSGTCSFHESTYFVTANPALPGNLGGADDWRQVTREEALVAQAIEVVPKGSGYWFIKDGAATFLVDNRSRQYRVLNEANVSEDVLDLPTMLQYKRINRPYSKYSLISSDRGIEFSPNRMFTHKPNAEDEDDFPQARAAFVLPIGKLTNVNVVDVRQWITGGGPALNNNNNGNASWRRPEMVAAALRGELSAKEREFAEKSTKLFVSPDNVPIYTLIVGDINKGHSVLRFDGSVGLNAISCMQAKGERKSAWRSTHYEKSSGFFLPSEMHDYWISYDKEGGIVGGFRRTMRINTSWVNKPVEQKEFELQSLGLKYGDRKFDEITGESFVFDDRSGFVPVSTFQMDESRYKLAQFGPPKTEP
jgi:hypothetical protein